MKSKFMSSSGSRVVSVMPTRTTLRCVTKKAFEIFQMVDLNGFRWVLDGFYMNLYGFRWLQMDLDGFRWVLDGSYMHLYGFRWVLDGFQMDLDGLRLVQMVVDAFRVILDDCRWVQMVPAPLFCCHSIAGLPVNFPLANCRSRVSNIWNTYVE